MEVENEIFIEPEFKIVGPVGLECPQVESMITKSCDGDEFKLLAEEFDHNIAIYTSEDEISAESALPSPFGSILDFQDMLQKLQTSLHTQNRENFSAMNVSNRINRTFARKKMVLDIEVLAEDLNENIDSLLEKSPFLVQMNALFSTKNRKETDKLEQLPDRTAVISGAKNHRPSEIKPSPRLSRKTSKESATDARMESLLSKYRNLSPLLKGTAYETFLDSSSDEMEFTPTENQGPIVSNVVSLKAVPKEGQKLMVHRGVDQNGYPTTRFIKVLPNPRQPNTTSKPNTETLSNNRHSAGQLLPIKVDQARKSGAKSRTRNRGPPKRGRVSGLSPLALQRPNPVAAMKGPVARSAVTPGSSKSSQMNNVMMETPDIELEFDAQPMARKFVGGAQVIVCSKCDKIFPYSRDNVYRMHCVVKHGIETQEDTLEEVFADDLDVECIECNFLIPKNSIDFHHQQCCKSKPKSRMFRSAERNTEAQFLHICSLCSLKFSSRLQLRHHLCAIHENMNFRVLFDPGFRCTGCLQPFETSFDVLSHAVDCNSKIPSQDTILEIALRLLYCDICEESHENLETTLLCYKNKKLLRCLICCRVFVKYTNFYKHLQLYHNGQGTNIPCPFCLGKQEMHCRFLFEHLVQWHYNKFISVKAPKVRIAQNCNVSSPKQDSTVNCIGTIGSINLFPVKATTTVSAMMQQPVSYPGKVAIPKRLNHYSVSKPAMTKPALLSAPRHLTRPLFRKIAPAGKAFSVSTTNPSVSSIMSSVPILNSKRISMTTGRAIAPKPPSATATATSGNPRPIIIPGLQTQTGEPIKVLFKPNNPLQIPILRQQHRSYGNIITDCNTIQASSLLPCPPITSSANTILMDSSSITLTKPGENVTIVSLDEDPPSPTNIKKEPENTIIGI